MKSFLEGFNEIVPLLWLQYFDERELEVGVDSCAGLVARLVEIAMMINFCILS